MLYLARWPVRNQFLMMNLTSLLFFEVTSPPPRTKDWLHELVFVTTFFFGFQHSSNSPLLLRSLSTSEDTSQEEEASSAGPLCQLDCSEERLRPVCGTDGITYPSRCHLQQVICQGSNVRLDYRGECSDSKCFLKCCLCSNFKEIC